MRVVPQEPVDDALVEAVRAALERDPRWLRVSTLLHRMLGERAPVLEELLSGTRSLAKASPLEKRAWTLYVETIVPMVRSGAIEGEGNFGVVSDDPHDDRPIDHPFVRVRAR